MSMFGLQRAVYIKRKTCIWKNPNSWFLSTPGNVGSPILFLHMGYRFPVGLSRRLTHCSQLVK